MNKTKRSENSKYYTTKADELFLSKYRNSPCFICDTKIKTCGHHIVSKKISKFLRYDNRNIVSLCPLHHKFSNDISAHSKNIFAVLAFYNYLEIKIPNIIKYLQSNIKTKTKKTYLQYYKELQDK